MQPVFNKYLALYKKLDIPGIGNFTVEQTPASLQFTDKQILPPVSRIKFAAVVHPTNNHFYSFLSREWNVDKVIAIRRYKEEVEKVIDGLKKLGICELKGIGILRKTVDGSINFAAAEPTLPLFSPLLAERIIRKHSQHTVLVGEQEQVKEYTLPEAENTVVYEGEQAEGNWKLYALIAAIVAVLMIVYYYATHSS